jgi:hypothetical protein
MSIASVSVYTYTPTNDQRPKESTSGRHLHLRRLLKPRRLRLRERRLERLLGKQGAEPLNHRLALHEEEQRMVFPDPAPDGVDSAPNYSLLVGSCATAQWPMSLTNASVA